MRVRFDESSAGSAPHSSACRRSGTMHYVCSLVVIGKNNTNTYRSCSHREITGVGRVKNSIVYGIYIVHCVMQTFLEIFWTTLYTRFRDRRRELDSPICTDIRRRVRWGVVATAWRGLCAGNPMVSSWI